MLTRLYRDGGQIATVGRPPIVLPLGRGIGGTTLVNGGTCFRTPDRVLARWSAEFGLHGLTPAALAPVFARVEATLGVAEVPPELAGANAALIRRGAERLGWSGGYLRRNARGCQGSGVCSFGCPTGAKQHAGDAYLAPARAAGALACTGARAERIVMRGGRAPAVEARTPAGGRLTVEADTSSSPPARSTRRSCSARTGSAAAPSWGATSASIRRPPSGASSTSRSTWSAASRSPTTSTSSRPTGSCWRGSPGRRTTSRMSAPFAGDRHRELMLRYRHLGQCGLMVSDRSRGRVRGRPGAPLIRYDLCREDVATLQRGLVRLAELLAAAGAHTLSCRSPGSRAAGADLAPLRALAPSRGDLKLMAFHPLGTARAHADPALGVVDGDLRVHGAENVYVADGSAVPSSLGVNPQITIMALATRLAFHLRSEPCPS